MIQLETAVIRRHLPMGADYRLLEMETPRISDAVRPGQFIHLLVPQSAGLTLRRPFSVFRSESGRLSVLYKLVGVGTAAMQALREGDSVSLMGPLGNGFPAAAAGAFPVLVAGGYGVAPLYFLAQRLASKGRLFVGAATSADLLCLDDFRELGWPVTIATQDGSVGVAGLVTAALDAWLAAEGKGRSLEFFACGPNGMLKAVGGRVIDRGDKGWLSLDRHMGCGAGACLACVQKVRKSGAETWARVCKDGPIFEARDVVWDEPGLGENKP
jgi:dihydroorotate dehydrogenase electron transfer subunit